MRAPITEQVVVLSEGLEIQGVLRPADSPKSGAVVFCHGAFEYKENWADYAEGLRAEGYPTFAFDFTGHGESQGQRSLVDLRVWAYNLRDIFNHLLKSGFRRFALVGWGCGGSAALLAAAHDRRVACASILAAPINLQPGLGDRAAYGLMTAAARVKRALTGKPLTLSRLKALSETRMAVDESVNERYLADPRVRAQHREVPIPGSLDSVWVDISRAVEKVQIPVLVLHGAEDRVVPLKQSENLLTMLQGEKKLNRIDGSGHALHLDAQKDAVYRGISDWVKRFLEV